MVDWTNIASFATAAARIAEEALLTGMRPLLIPSHPDDPTYKVLWSDRHTARVSGGRAIFELENGVIYLAVGLRNLGSGIAFLHGWDPAPDHAFDTCPTPIRRPSGD